MEKRYCSRCELPMFRYAMRHNGQQVEVYRCMSVHGTQDAQGQVRTIRGRRQAKGKREVFRVLYGKAVASVDP